jgi:hypothetical protein
MAAKNDQARRAGRLIHWGLHPQARPAQELEYQELVDLYLDDISFRETVRDVADGLGLGVLDVSEHGIVLAPEEGSIFALKPSEFRPAASKVDDRLLDGLVQLAVAATVFPRARDLDDDPDLVRPPVTVDEVESRLRGLCAHLAEHASQTPDPDATDEVRGLVEAWRVYEGRLAVQETKDSRRAARATRSIIEYALERLREFGCFTQIRQGEASAWQPTRRYQIMVQRLAATKLYEYVRTLGDPSGGSV